MQIITLTCTEFTDQIPHFYHQNTSLKGPPQHNKNPSLQDHLATGTLQDYNTTFRRKQHTCTSPIKRPPNISTKDNPF